MSEANEHEDKTVSIRVLTPGSVLGQYKIIDRLGAGAMGEIYLAEDINLGRKVALKFLSAAMLSDDTLKERFKREARSAAALNHPNIVTIYGVDELEGRAYIAMEFVEGRSLKEIIDSKSLSVEQAIHFTLQICDGLAAAHKAGIVHRDIKPLNLMVDLTGRLRILDFGLAKETGGENLTQVGTAIGTVNYMSPEQSQGLEADHLSDLFSTGVVLYEMLTGQVPFRKANIPATLHAIIHDEPPPLHLPNPQYQSALRTVMKKALAKDSAQRYKNMEALAGDLRQLVAAETSQYSQSMFSGSVPIAARSLAVLHLQNMGSPEDDFLCYGITEDLIIDLTRIGTIRVAPMRAIMKYKDSDADLEEIAASLKADLILDGSIFKTGNSIRVSAQLIDINDGSNLWAERWEEPLDNLPNVKKALADGISNSLNLGQTVIRKAAVGTPETEDAGAYENYLKGKFAFQHKKSVADVDIALGLYRQALEKEPGMLAARAGLAEVLIHKGDLSTASVELKSALEASQGSNRGPELAELLRLQAQLNISYSRWEKAEESARKAIQLSKNMDDLAGEAEAAGILIAALQPQSKFDETLEMFDRVLAISRKLDDQEKIGEALKNMGTVYSRKGDYGRAIELYEESLDIARQREDRTLQAACLSNIGNIHFFQGDLDKAFEFYKEALGINKEIGNGAGVARQSLNLGLIHLQRANYEEGLELLQTAASSFENLGDRANLALTLGNISQVKLVIGDPGGAIMMAERAISIAEKINHPLALLTAYHRLGQAYSQTGDFERGAKNLKSALGIATENNMIRNMAGLELDLAGFHYLQDEFDHAESHVRRGQSLAREIGEKNLLAVAGAYLGAFEASKGLFNSGLRQLEKQNRFAEETKDPHLKQLISQLMGETLYKYGKDADKETGRQILENLSGELSQASDGLKLRRITETLKS